MILTNKCKEDFLLGYYGGYQDDDIDDLERDFLFHNQLERLVYYIDFFDKNKIYVYAKPSNKINEWWSEIKDFYNDKILTDGLFVNRKTAIEKAIEKANEIYNANLG